MLERGRELYREGKLSQAVECLQGYLRDKPSDAAARIFLFELLCFTGDFDRVERQLLALDACPGDFANMTKLYRAAIRAERFRQELAVSSEASADEPDGLTGTVDGKAFHAFSDADPQLGARLEFIGADQFHRIPFRLLRRISISPPAHLRDLYFLPATIETGPELEGFSFEQVFLPALYPGSYGYDDESLRLGRVTEWFDDGDTVRLAGRRLLLVDGEEVDFLSVRSIEFTFGEVDLPA